MPLPIVHAFLGAAIAEAMLAPDTPHRGFKVAALGCLAVAPDLDFIPVWGWGADRDWHRGFSHSFLAAIGVGASALLGRSASRFRDMAACSLAVASHGILDAITTAEGRGVQLLWPFSDYRAMFGIVDVWEMSPDWIGTSETARAIQASLVELLLLGPLLMVGIVWLRRLRAGDGDGS